MTSPLNLAAVGGAGGPQVARPALPIEWAHDMEPSLTGLWLVKRLLPAVGVAVVYGHPGAGKTFWILDVAFHVALGWNWSGRRVRQGLVVYVAAEGVSGLRNRVAAFRKHHGITERMPFAVVPCAIDLQAPDADVRKLAEAIRFTAEQADAEPALIAIDTLSKTFGGGKENSDDMVSYVANCSGIAAEFQCCVAAVHHRPKDAESAEPRGHSSLKGGVDTVVLVEDGATRRAEITKQKDGETGHRFLFNLTSVELGFDEDHEPVTSCIVETAATDLSPAIDPFAGAVSKLSAGSRLAYDQLGELIATEGFDPPPTIPGREIDRSVVGKIVSLTAWRDKAISAAGTDAGQSRDTGKRAFNRAVPLLRNAGVVRVWDDFAWITHRIAGTAPGHAPGHDRDTGTAGTHPLRGCPGVPPRSEATFVPDSEIDPADELFRGMPS